jgi:hypothetical protein
MVTGCYQYALLHLQLSLVSFIALILIKAPSRKQGMIDSAKNLFPKEEAL